MKQLPIQELDIEVGDIVVCVLDASGMYTAGKAYEVEQAEDGRYGVQNDCGFLATTSASLFTPEIVAIETGGLFDSLKPTASLPSSFVSTTLAYFEVSSEASNDKVNDNFPLDEGNVQRASSDGLRTW